jgi:hypothetical protein
VFGEAMLSNRLRPSVFNNQQFVAQAFGQGRGP